MEGPIGVQHPRCWHRGHWTSGRKDGRRLREETHPLCTHAHTGSINDPRGTGANVWDLYSLASSLEFMHEERDLASFQVSHFLRCQFFQRCRERWPIPGFHLQLWVGADRAEGQGGGHHGNGIRPRSGFLQCAINYHMFSYYTSYLCFHFICNSMPCGFLCNIILLLHNFNSGAITLCGCAYLLRHWRHLQLAVGSLTVLVLLGFPMVPESPRWLHSKGREDRALEIIRKMAKGLMANNFYRCYIFVAKESHSTMLYNHYNVDCLVLHAQFLTQFL